MGRVENEEKEGISFVVGIKFAYGDNKLKPKMMVRDINMPRDVVINQLRNLIKMLEEDYYPDFKNNITKIGIGSE